MNLFRQQAYVAGQWIDGAETLTVTNPATGEVVGTVPSLGASETRQAIEKAAEVQVHGLPAPPKTEPGCCAAGSS